MQPLVDCAGEIPKKEKPTATDSSSPAQISFSAVIPGWHPTMSANGSHGHWSTQRKKHHIDRDTAWAAAKQAGWKFIPGKVRLTITLVYPRKYRVDADNLAARCKGMIDGLRLPLGFFADDSTEWLELEVRAEVVPGVKETRMELVAAEGDTI